MNDEFKKEWLEWVLDFVQGDLLKLSRVGKFRFYPEIAFFCSNQFLSKQWRLYEEEIEFSQNQISEWDPIAPKVQSALKELLEYIAPSSGHRTIDPYPLPELTSSIGPPAVHLGLLRPFFHVDSIPKKPSPSNWAILNLARLMDGTASGVISRCKGCDLYFLNFSLREKIYCTSKCASRTSTRLRREKIYQDPKKKKAYLRDLLRRNTERYEQIRLEKTGKKVRHRSRKVL